MIDCLFVGFGGFIGSVLRYLIGRIPLKNAGAFPLLTLVINVAGAFALGFLAAYLSKSACLNPRYALFWKVGVCGGFTTFSTFSLEALTLFQNGRAWTGAAYILLSVTLGVAGAVFGMRLCR